MSTTNNSLTQPYPGNGTGFQQSPYGQVGPYQGSSFPMAQPVQYPSTYYPQTTRPYSPIAQQLGGRIVEKDDVTPNEIPMDGSIYLFPKSDYSCIFAKQWRKDGTGVDTITYVPLMSEEQQLADDANKSAIDEILSRLDGIEATLKQQNKPKNNYQRKNQNGSYRRDNKEE